MGEHNEVPTDRERRLDEAVAAYFQAREAGEPVDRAAFLARYPDLADELTSFLDDAAAFARRAGASAPPPAGVRSFGDYELLEEIAAGGMGVVWRVRQVSLKRTVALKMIQPGQFDSPDAVRRFHLEAEAAANLDHPNIVPIYEIGEHDGRHYFTMKLIEGSSLAARVQDYGADPAAAARVVAEVARVVHHAHRHGLLHRDLKPANVLLDKQDTPHVTDFGLAKRVEAATPADGEGEAAAVPAPTAGNVPGLPGTIVVFRADPAAAGASRPGLTQAGAILGTPSYMAPEQAAGRRHLTTAVDVWGLGAILYELLTGRPPFQAGTPVDTLLQVLEQPVRPPREINPRVDLNLNAICSKCLEKDPDRRYASAEDLAGDLECWLGRKPIQARRWSSVEYGVHLVREGGPVVGFLLVVLLGLVGFVVKDPLAVLKRSSNPADIQKALEGSRKLLAALEDEKYRETAVAQRYYHQVATADRELTANNPKRAEHLLSECATGLRDFEWTYLQARCGGAAPCRTIAAAAGCRPVCWENAYTWLAWRDDKGPGTLRLGILDVELSEVKISLDGLTVRRVVAGHHLGKLALVGEPAGRPGRLGTVSVWDLETGRERCRLEGHRGGTLAVAFDKDDKRFLTAGADGRVTLWDLETGKVVRSVDGVGTGVALAPDGQRFAACKDGEVHVWDATTGEQRQTLSVPGSRVVFAPTGDNLAVVAPGPGGTDEVQVWDLGKQPRMLFTLRGHAGAVRSVAFSFLGRRLATAGEDGTVKVWPGVFPGPALEPVTELLTLRDAGASVTELLFHHHDDGLLVTRADGSVVLWEVASSR